MPDSSDYEIIPAVFARLIKENVTDPEDKKLVALDGEATIRKAILSWLIRINNDSNSINEFNKADVFAELCYDRAASGFWLCELVSREECNNALQAYVNRTGNFPNNTKGFFPMIRRAKFNKIREDLHFSKKQIKAIRDYKNINNGVDDMNKVNMPAMTIKTLPKLNLGKLGSPLLKNTKMETL